MELSMQPRDGSNGQPFDPFGNDPYQQSQPWQPSGPAGQDPNAGQYPPATSQYPTSEGGGYVDPFAQPQYGTGQYPQPQYPQPQHAQPQYGQYGQPPYGQPPYGQPGGVGGPPRPPNNTAKIIAAIAAAVVVLAAAVVIALVATHKDKNTAGGLSSSQRTAQLSTSGGPTSSDTTSTDTNTNTDTTTTDTSSGSSSGSTDCSPSEDASSAVIDLTVTLAFIPAGGTPSSFFQKTLQSCVEPALLSQMPQLYGKIWGIPSEDKTGGHDAGPTAEYTFSASNGGTLDITMKKESDGAYQATKFTYNG
jgi:hypothetical protein